MCRTNTGQHLGPHERNEEEMGREIQRQIDISQMQKVFFSEWLRACRVFAVQSRLWPCSCCRMICLLGQTAEPSGDDKKLPPDLWQAQINQPRGPSTQRSSHLDQPRSQFEWEFSSLNRMPCLSERNPNGTVWLLTFHPFFCKMMWSSRLFCPRWTTLTSLVLTFTAEFTVTFWNVAAHLSETRTGTRLSLSSLLAGEVATLAPAKAYHFPYCALQQSFSLSVSYSI